jgi:hypothetical protein
MTVGLLIAGIAILELFFNIAGIGMEEILQPDPIFGTVHIPNKKVVWRMEGFSSESFTSAGMRDNARSIAKPAGVRRIALLGDSAAEGLQVPLRDTFGQQMQNILSKDNQPCN